MGLNTTRHTAAASLHLLTTFHLLFRLRSLLLLLYGGPLRRVFGRNHNQFVPKTKAEQEDFGYGVQLADTECA